MNTVPTCHCGALLAIELVPSRETTPMYSCHCPSCRARAERGEGDGFIVDVDGYGNTPDAAAADWRSRRDTF